MKIIPDGKYLSYYSLCCQRTQARLDQSEGVLCHTGENGACREEKEFSQAAIPVKCGLHRMHSVNLIKLFKKTNWYFALL